MASLQFADPKYGVTTDVGTMLPTVSEIMEIPPWSRPWALRHLAADVYELGGSLELILDQAPVLYTRIIMDAWEEADRRAHRIGA